MELKRRKIMFYFVCTKNSGKDITSEKFNTAEECFINLPFNWEVYNRTQYAVNKNDLETYYHSYVVYDVHNKCDYPMEWRTALNFDHPLLRGAFVDDEFILWIKVFQE